MHALLPALSSMIVFAAALFWTIGHGDTVTSATAIGFTVVFTITIGGTVVAALIVAQISYEQSRSSLRKAGFLRGNFGRDTGDCADGLVAPSAPPRPCWLS
ncbi:hypothetical protein [Hyphomicrobium sp. 2TAF46]|uniref:hypothetical protein n=1 Tax=Hyphomicrobium sp. 2TAF46 TaxID=3233019 RepID=UPI003F903C66